QAASSQSDEASNLWKRLEKEHWISPTPDSLGDEHRAIHGTQGNAECISRRGRWKVKVEETPTISSSIPIETAFCGTSDSPSSRCGHASEDLELTESAVDIDHNSAPVLREIPTTELF